jgi:hypothetical protein
LAISGLDWLAISEGFPPSDLALLREELKGIFLFAPGLGDISDFGERQGGRFLLTVMMSHRESIWGSLTLLM